ncbi:MAG: hypothetical protein ACRDRL_33050, partial [Sciscionella sp.]
RGLYGAILFGPSSYLRHGLGPRISRLVHRFVSIVYALAVWNTLLNGNDVAAWQRAVRGAVGDRSRWSSPSPPGCSPAPGPGERLQLRCRRPLTAFPAPQPATD